MTEAWAKRSFERQVLLESLMRQAYAEDEKQEDLHFLFRLAKTCLGYLQQRRNNTPRRDMQDEEPLFSDILRHIREFARSQVEGDAMVAEFAAKVVELALSHFRMQLQREEHESPGLIFQASSAMSRVSLE